MLKLLLLAAAWIDLDGNILQCNDRARGEAAADALVRFCHSPCERVVFEDQADWLRLRAVKTAFVHDGANRAPDFIIVDHGLGNERYIVHVLTARFPGDADEELPFEAPAVLICWKRLFMPCTVEYASLVREFGLSAAEADVFAQLGQGLDINGIARSRAVSTFTVRNQVRNIAEKLGVSRQAEMAVLNAELSYFCHPGEAAAKGVPALANA